MSAPSTVLERLPAIADEVERLLPRGPLWRFRQGSIFRRLIEGLALPLAWLEWRAEQLLSEADPRTTVELLTDFERVYGLPDCSSTSNSLVARRAAVVRKVNSPVGQTELELASVVHNYGLECVIETNQILEAGIGEIGDELTGELWAHALTVHLPDPPVVFFEADWSGAGDALAEHVGAALECALLQVAPAHAVLIFQYDIPNHAYQPWDPFEPTLVPASALPSAPTLQIEES